jgi:hypothetical protein
MTTHISSIIVNGMIDNVATFVALQFRWGEGANAVGDVVNAKIAIGGNFNP